MANFWSGLKTQLSKLRALKAGFTLAEVLTCLIIVGVVTAIALPLATNSGIKTESDARTHVVTSDLQSMERLAEAQLGYLDVNSPAMGPDALLSQFTKYTQVPQSSPQYNQDAQVFTNLPASQQANGMQNNAMNAQTNQSPFFTTTLPMTQSTCPVSAGVPLEAGGNTSNIYTTASGMIITHVDHTWAESNNQSYVCVALKGTQSSAQDIVAIPITRGGPIIAPNTNNTVNTGGVSGGGGPICTLTCGSGYTLDPTDCVCVPTGCQLTASSCTPGTIFKPATCTCDPSPGGGGGSLCPDGVPKPESQTFCGTNQTYDGTCCQNSGSTNNCPDGHPNPESLSYCSAIGQTLGSNGCCTTNPVNCPDGHSNPETSCPTGYNPIPVNGCCVPTTCSTSCTSDQTQNADCSCTNNSCATNGILSAADHTAGDTTCCGTGSTAQAYNANNECCSSGTVTDQTNGTCAGGGQIQFEAVINGTTLSIAGIPVKIQNCIYEGSGITLTPGAVTLTPYSVPTTLNTATIMPPGGAICTAKIKNYSYQSSTYTGSVTFMVPTSSGSSNLNPAVFATVMPLQSLLADAGNTNLTTVPIPLSCVNCGAPTPGNTCTSVSINPRVSGSNWNGPNSGFTGQLICPDGYGAAITNTSDTNYHVTTIPGDNSTLLLATLNSCFFSASSPATSDTIDGTTYSVAAGDTQLIGTTPLSFTQNKDGSCTATPVLTPNDVGTVSRDKGGAFDPNENDCGTGNCENINGSNPNFISNSDFYQSAETCFTDPAVHTCDTCLMYANNFEAVETSPVTPPTQIFCAPKNADGTYTYGTDTYTFDSSNGLCDKTTGYCDIDAKAKTQTGPLKPPYDNLQNAAENGTTSSTIYVYDANGDFMGTVNEGTQAGQVNNDNGTGTFVDQWGITHTIDEYIRLVSPIKINLDAQSAQVDSDNHFLFDTDGFQKHQVGDVIITSGGLGAREAWLMVDVENNGFVKNNALDGNDVFGDHNGKYKSGYENLVAMFKNDIKTDKSGKRYIPLHKLNWFESTWIWATRSIGLNNTVNPSYDLKLVKTDFSAIPAYNVLTRVYVDYRPVNEHDGAKHNYILQRAKVIYIDGQQADSADQWFSPIKIIQYKN